MSAPSGQAVGGDEAADIEATQRVVAPLLGKPAKARFLRRPPVRFIRNVFQALSRSTGFAAELYTEAEVSDATLRSKDGKLWFVAKLVAVVGQVASTAPPVSAGKVIAGLEPHNTRAFLRQLVAAAHAPADKAAAATARVKEAANTKRQQVKACTHIQAHWRGHQVRSRQLPHRDQRTGSSTGSDSDAYPESSGRSNPATPTADRRPRVRAGDGGDGDGGGKDPGSQAVTPASVSVAAAHMSPMAMKLRVVAESFRDGLISKDQYALLKDSILRETGGLSDTTSGANVVQAADNVARGGTWDDGAGEQKTNGARHRRRPKLASSSRLFGDHASPYPDVGPTPQVSHALPSVSSTRSLNMVASGAAPSGKPPARASSGGSDGRGTGKARRRRRARASGQDASGGGGGGGGTSRSEGARGTGSRGSATEKGDARSGSAGTTGTARTNSSSSRRGRSKGKDTGTGSDGSGNRKAVGSGSGRKGGRRGASARSARPRTAGSSSMRSAVSAGSKSAVVRPPMPPCAQLVASKGGVPLFDQDWLFQFDTRMEALAGEFQRQVEGRSSVAAVTAMVSRNKKRR